MMKLRQLTPSPKGRSRKNDVGKLLLKLRCVKTASLDGCGTDRYHGNARTHTYDASIQQASRGTKELFFGA
jgi:hypothetical protein